MRARSAAAFARGWSALTAVMGGDELVLLVALTLITVALWPLFERRALLAPGVVLLWIALPSRAPFVARSVDKRKGD